MLDISLKVIFLSALLTIAGCSVFNLIGMDPTVKYTVKAVDYETGEAIPNATLEGSFSFLHVIYGRDWSREFKVLTDANGMATIEGRSHSPGSIQVFSNDFYALGTSCGAHPFEPGKYKQSHIDKILNRWEPWNETYLMRLRRKHNPTAMYERHFIDRNLAPENRNKELEFDFIEGDWLPPYGKGKVVDLTVFVPEFADNDSEPESNAKWRLRFVRPGDGFIKVDKKKYIGAFILPYEAPEAGYQREWEYWLSRDKYREEPLNYSDVYTYIFRIRSEADAAGNIIGGLYGYCTPPDFYGKSFGFQRYFLNPFDRSLEYNGCDLSTNDGLMNAIMEELAKTDPKVREIVKNYHNFNRKLHDISFNPDLSDAEYATKIKEFKMVEETRNALPIYCEYSQSLTEDQVPEKFREMFRNQNSLK